MSHTPTWASQGSQPPPCLPSPPSGTAHVPQLQGRLSLCASVRGRPAAGTGRRGASPGGLEKGRVSFFRSNCVFRLCHMYVCVLLGVSLGSSPSCCCSLLGAPDRSAVRDPLHTKSVRRGPALAFLEAEPTVLLSLEGVGPTVLGGVTSTYTEVTGPASWSRGCDANFACRVWAPAATSALTGGAAQREDVQLDRQALILVLVVSAFDL